MKRKRSVEGRRRRRSWQLLCLRLPPRWKTIRSALEPYFRFAILKTISEIIASLL